MPIDHTPRTLREVYFVDGLRTPFGKAGGYYAETRADDLVVKCITELLRRNPEVPPDRIGEVAIAATTQIGDQGLTIGRTAALLAGLPVTVPGYSIDRMCAGAMTAVTTAASAIAFGSTDLALAGGVEHMSRHPMGEGLDANPRFLAERIVDPDALVMGKTAENLHDRYPEITKERCDAFAMRSHQRAAAAYSEGILQPDLVPVATRNVEQGYGLATVDEALRPDTSLETLAKLAYAVPAARQGHPGQCVGHQRRRHDVAVGGPGDRRRTGPDAEDAPGVLCLRGCRSGRDGHRTRCRRPNERWLRRGSRWTTSAPSRSTRRSPCRFSRSSTTSALPTRIHGSILTAARSPWVTRWRRPGVRLMNQLATRFAAEPGLRYGVTTMCIGIGMGGTVIWENLNQEDAVMSDLFERAAALASDAEVVTHALLRKVPLRTTGMAAAGVMGLITLDNGQDHRRPNTFGATGLLALNTAIDAALADPDVNVDRHHRKALHLCRRCGPGHRRRTWTGGGSGDRRVGARDLRQARTATSRPSRSSMAWPWAAGSSSLCTATTARCRTRPAHSGCPK